MIYEFRKYETTPGGLPEQHRRFREGTLDAFDRNGIRPVGFWVGVIGRSEEINYMLQWESLAERETKWAALFADQEWGAHREASRQRAGVVVSRWHNEIWTPTDYSPMK